MIVDTSLKEIIGIDMGAMPKRFIRTLDIEFYDCKGERFHVFLKPNEEFKAIKCKNKPISWEGIVKWDGRYITGVEKEKSIWKKWR